MAPSELADIAGKATELSVDFLKGESRFEQSSKPTADNQFTVIEPFKAARATTRIKQEPPSPVPHGCDWHTSNLGHHGECVASADCIGVHDCVRGSLT